MAYHAGILGKGLCPVSAAEVGPHDPFWQGNKEEIWQKVGEIPQKLRRNVLFVDGNGHLAWRIPVYSGGKSLVLGHPDAWKSADAVV